jgi:predicted methyltransferase
LNALELKISDDVTLAVPANLDAITTYVLLEQETWFEKEMIFLRHWLRPGMTVIDIGANLGIYSVPMARLVGPTGQVYAYEPGSETRALLERSREINAAVNLHISASALSDSATAAREKQSASPASIPRMRRVAGHRLILSKSMRRARRSAFSRGAENSSRSTRR